MQTPYAARFSHCEDLTAFLFKTWFPFKIVVLDHCAKLPNLVLTLRIPDQRLSQPKVEAEVITREGVQRTFIRNHAQSLRSVEIQVVPSDNYTIDTMWQETEIIKNINQADKQLVDLMLFALDHGIENIRIKGKGPLVPFIVTEINGEKEVTRFFKNHLKDGLSEAIRYLKEERKSHFAVLAYDELLPVNNQKFHAVIVRGYDRTDTVGYTLAQRYVPSGFFSFFKLAGNKEFLGNADSLLQKAM